MQKLTKKVKDMCRQGKTLHMVYHLGEDYTSIETHYITKNPEFDPDIGAWFCNKNSNLDFFSLEDANILPNDYNKHKTFSSLRKAISHAKSINPNYRYEPQEQYIWEDGI